MTQTLYYAQLDDEYFGPFALETIFGMNLTPDVLVLSTETNEWKQACEYPELIDSLDLSLYELNDDETIQRNSEDNPAHNDRIIPSFSERSIFYIRRGGNPYGPYNIEALASVSLSENSEISLDGMISWFKLYEIPGLMNTLSAISNMQVTNQQTEQGSFNAFNSEEITSILNRIQGLTPTKKPMFKRVFESKESERNFLISDYNRVFDTLLNLIKALDENCRDASINRKAISAITNNVNDVVFQINNHYKSQISRLDSVEKDYTTPSIEVGQTHFSLLPPLENIEITRLDFLTILGDRNLLITYDANSGEKAFGFVNSVIAKLYESNPARLIETEVIDVDYMTGLDNSFKLLNRDLYNVISRTDNVRSKLVELQDRASTIHRNLLVEKDATLQEYNSTHENKETNILLVLKNFPNGLTIDNLAVIKKLSNVGPKSGIYIVVIASNASISNMTDKEKEAFDIEAYRETTNYCNFSDNKHNLLNILEGADSTELIEGDVEYNILSESELKKIVKEINAKCELHEDVIVSIYDYLPETAEWWSHGSAKQIEIPFGIGNDMHIKSLKITQESGQNSAIVIGIPGSGKSVFLHSLICNAAIKYSPDELRMYLIDFSGVEFNTYALGNLPHARVIAPEAEREFGLTILRELVEEGSRRMALCRENNVSNIVDLKKVAPGIKVPRLLVIIDEFQKLFEIESDKISAEAISKIHIIIQEFRKFGINLILATQRLPKSAWVPNDLIANRVVFKSAPHDFDNLIKTENRNGAPQLRTGQCVYNSESGAAYGNEIVQGFYVSRNDIDKILEEISSFEKTKDYEREPLKVFRSSEQPEFAHKRHLPTHSSFIVPGQPVPIYLGESIAVSEYDVCVELEPESGNNLLIIGGESDVAQNICFHSLMSETAVHQNDSASFVILNGMRKDNPYAPTMMVTLRSMPFPMLMPTNTADIEAVLTEIKNKIEERRHAADTSAENIYIGIFDFQNCSAFDKDMSGKYEKPSVSATLLEYIIKNGPSANVYTVLQVNTFEQLQKIGSVLSAFNYRVALQMTEAESNKIMNSPAANRLFVFNRPSSRFMAYMYDAKRELSIKFKPYKSV